MEADSQAEVPDQKSICPDRPRRKMSMSRPSQTESAYVQTIVRSKLSVRSSCVQSQICSDHPRPKAYMSRLSCVLIRTIVRSKSNSCLPKLKFWCVHVHTIVRSCPDFRAFTRLKKNNIHWRSAIPWRWRRQRDFKIWLFSSGRLVDQIEPNLD